MARIERRPWVVLEVQLNHLGLLAISDLARQPKEMMDKAILAEQRRLVPRIAWRRFVDLIRTRK